MTGLEYGGLDSGKSIRAFHEALRARNRLDDFSRGVLAGMQKIPPWVGCRFYPAQATHATVVWNQG